MSIDVDSLHMEKLADEYFNRKMEKGEGFDLKHGWRKIFKETYAQAIQDNAAEINRWKKAVEAQEKRCGRLRDTIQDNMEAVRFLEYAKDSDLYYEFTIKKK